MEIPAFTLPDWLEGCDSDTIQKRMMERLPQDIDKTEGGFPWDFTAPTALELAELLQFHIPETLKIMYPMWAYGEWLDYHARCAGTERKAANSASGIVRVTGLEGTTIPSGFRFAVPTDGTAPAVEFAAARTSNIGAEGYVDIEVIAVEPGITGNVAAGTVTVMSEPISGIKSISNPEEITGGTVEETDDSLRERIQEIYSADESFVGNDADFRRWAMEVPGIGDCIVIPAEVLEKPGEVKLVLIDGNGQPANEHLVEAVYNHIVSPDDRSMRLLPTACAKLECVAATTVKINYTITGLLFDETTDIDQIKKDFAVALKSVYEVAKEENLLRYNDQRPVISAVPGVEDFDTFLVNGATENVVLKLEEYPEIGTLDFS